MRCRRAMALNQHLDCVAEARFGLWRCSRLAVEKWMSGKIARREARKLLAWRFFFSNCTQFSICKNNTFPHAHTPARLPRDGDQTGWRPPDIQEYHRRKTWARARPKPWVSGARCVGACRGADAWSAICEVHIQGALRRQRSLLLHLLLLRGRRGRRGRLAPRRRRGRGRERGRCKVNDTRRASASIRRAGEPKCGGRWRRDGGCVIVIVFIRERWCGGAGHSRDDDDDDDEDDDES